MEIREVESQGTITAEVGRTQEGRSMVMFNRRNTGSLARFPRPASDCPCSSSSLTHREVPDTDITPTPPLAPFWVPASALKPTLWRIL